MAHERDPKKFSNPFLNRQSRQAYANDLKRRQQAEPRFFAKPQDRRSEKSKDFARKWLGGDC